MRPAEENLVQELMDLGLDEAESDDTYEVLHDGPVHSMIIHV